MNYCIRKLDPEDFADAADEDDRLVTVQKPGLEPVGAHLRMADFDQIISRLPPQAGGERSGVRRARGQLQAGPKVIRERRAELGKEGGRVAQLGEFDDALQL